MRRIVTKDGSATYHNPVYDETYHSVSGAMEEACKKYVQACRIGELACARILDIGFGLGYNSCAAIDRIRSRSGKVEIIGLEKDRKALDLIQGVEICFRSYGIIKDAARTLSYEKDAVKVDILLGDARETILSAGSGFDAVFHDPFSLPKNPELWTERFFRDVFLRMRPGARLATYSCAREARDNMEAAGFFVEDWPAVGRRGPSTVAIKQD